MRLHCICKVTGERSRPTINHDIVFSLSSPFTPRAKFVLRLVPPCFSLTRRDLLHAELRNSDGQTDRRRNMLSGVVSCSGALWLVNEGDGMEAAGSHRHLITIFLCSRALARARKRPSPSLPTHELHNSMRTVGIRQTQSFWHPRKGPQV